MNRPLISSLVFFARKRGAPSLFLVSIVAKNKILLSKFDHHDGFNVHLQIYHCSHKRDVVNTAAQMFPRAMQTRFWNNLVFAIPATIYYSMQGLVNGYRTVLITHSE